MARYIALPGVLFNVGVEGTSQLVNVKDLNFVTQCDTKINKFYHYCCEQAGLGVESGVG